MHCVACNKHIDRGELLGCSSCRRLYDYKCLGMSEDYYSTNLSELKRAWICPSCNNITRRKNDNTPVRNRFDILSEEADMSCDDLLPNTSSADSDSKIFLQTSFDTRATKQPLQLPEMPCSISYDRFGELLDSKLESIRIALTADIKKELTAAIDHLKDEFTHTTDFLAAEQKDIRDKIASVDNTMISLQSENVVLRAEMNELNRRLQTLEKSSRCRNIEIHSVPERKSENLVSIFERLCDELNVSTPNTDVLCVRRVAKMNSDSDRPRNILVTLQSERQRDELISAIRQYNKKNTDNQLNSSHLGIPGEKRTIYLSEHLSPECKKLHAATRKAAKEQAYKFVWVKYGRIYVRKNEQTPAILIKEASCLSKLT